jgi:5,10-methylenetetrahydromethanopterin reductase
MKDRRRATVLRLGIVLQFWPMSSAELGDFFDLARMAEDYGISALGASDTSFVMGDASVRLTLAALGSRSAQVGMQPTNPLTREPQVMASMLASLDALTDGRAFMNIGSGDSSVLNIGLRPAPRAIIADYVCCVRDLLATGAGTFQGRDQSIQWGGAVYRPAVPIGILGEGPRMLELAGRIGDAAVIGSGLTPDVIQESRGRVEAGAIEQGRAPGSVDVWFTARAALNMSRDYALAQVKGPVASVLNHAMRSGLDGKCVPSELRPRIEEYVASYHLSDHAGTRNVELMDALGLTGWALERWAIVGTPRDWIERLANLSATGATQLWFTIGRSIETQRESLRLLGEQVLPFLS